MRARASVDVLGLAGLLGLAACGADEDRDADGPTGLSITAGLGSSGPADSDPDKLDVGSVDSAGPPDGQGCAKVDFLFVIDNSQSMADYQARLVASFPGFVDIIQGALGQAQDYNIMVTETDPAPQVDCPSACPPAVASDCVNANTCTPYNPDNPLCTPTCLEFLDCVSLPGGCGSPPAPTGCDIMGAGVTYPRGHNASNTECVFTSGGRYIDSTEPSLADAFDCAARVGTNARGTTERPLGSILAALDPASPANACNAGFLRDDAILVITFITDEDDGGIDGTPGTVEQWRQAVIAAKNGDEAAVVVFGLLGNEDDGCGEDSVRLDDFITAWGDNGRKGSICADSYIGFFEDVVGLIDSTCDDFVPPG